MLLCSQALSHQALQASFQLARALSPLAARHLANSSLHTAAAASRAAQPCPALEDGPQQQQPLAQPPRFAPQWPAACPAASPALESRHSTLRFSTVLAQYR